MFPVDKAHTAPEFKIANDLLHRVDSKLRQLEILEESKEKSIKEVILPELVCLRTTVRDHLIGVCNKLIRDYGFDALAPDSRTESEQYEDRFFKNQNLICANKLVLETAYDFCQEALSDLDESIEKIKNDQSSPAPKKSFFEDLKSRPTTRGAYQGENYMR